MPTDTAAWTAILLIVAITFASRVAGVLMMRFVKISRKIEVFLDAVSVSVIAALVASLLAQTGLREVAAVAAAAFVMMVAKSPAMSMIAGMSVAGLWAATGIA